MKLTDKRIEELQALLSEQLGLEYSRTQAHEAGLAIIRFVVAKASDKTTLI